MPANDGQKPTQIFTPRNTILLIISLIVIMLLSSFIGYTIAQKTNTKSITTETSLDNKMMSDTAKSSTLNTSSNPALVAPKDTTPTIAPVATTQPEVWTGEITLKPRNADTMIKEVSKTLSNYPSDNRDNGFCGNSGIVTYKPLSSQYKKDDGRGNIDTYYSQKITIINKNLPFEDQLFGNIFNLEVDYLNKGGVFAKTDKVDLSRDTPFNNSSFNFVTGCRLEFYPSGVTLEKPKEFKAKDYEIAVYGVDQFGVYIKGKKGDNIVYMTTGSSLINNVNIQNCEIKFPSQGISYTEEAIKCIVEVTKSKFDYQKSIDEALQELQIVFAL